MGKGGQERHGIVQKLNTVCVLCGNYRLNCFSARKGYLVLAVASREVSSVVPSRCGLGQCSALQLNEAIWNLYFDLNSF